MLSIIKITGMSAGVKLAIIHLLLHSSAVKEFHCLLPTHCQAEVIQHADKTETCSK